MKRDDEPLEPRPITVRQTRAAKKLGISPRMLEQLRRDGTGPPSFLLAGRCRLYLVADLVAWARRRAAEAREKALTTALTEAALPGEKARLDIGGTGENETARRATRRATTNAPPSVTKAARDES